MLFIQFAMCGRTLLERRINTILMEDMPYIIEQLFDKFLLTTIQHSFIESETKTSSAEKLEELKKYANPRVWQAIAATPTIEITVPTEHKEKFEEIFKPLERPGNSAVQISIDGMMVFSPFLGAPVLLPEETSLRIVYFDQPDFKHNLEPDNDPPSEG